MRTIPAALAISLLVSCRAASGREEAPVMAIELRSDAFNPGGAIPSKFTCEGRELSPALKWTGVPAQAKALALIMDDPDAPAGTWDHWLLYDLPAALAGLPEGAKSAALDGAKDGKNSWGRTGYGGPCPPSGTHRYFFKLYALDAPTGLKPGADKKTLLKAMGGHILASGELIGRYKKKG